MATNEIYNPELEDIVLSDSEMALNIEFEFDWANYCYDHLDAEPESENEWDNPEHWVSDRRPSEK